MLFAPSRYTILTPLHGRRALAYNALSGAMAVWTAEDQAVYQRLSAGDPIDASDPTLRELLHGGFAVFSGTDELSILEKQYQAHRFDPKTMILTVAPTLACNFACDYCFQGQDKPAAGMSMDVQNAVLAMIERAAPGIGRLHIAWYGGEPLLRRDIVLALSDRVIELCDRRRIEYDAMIVTNGYFLDAAAARSLWSRRVKLAQITLDGVPSYHDARRHLHSKKGTFDRIVENLTGALDAAPLQVTARVNIDDRNRDDIGSLLDHLAERGLARRKGFSVYFAPVEAMTAGCHGVEDVCMSKADYGLLEADLYRRAFEIGLSPLPYPPRFRGTCAAIRPKGFVIVPSGDIHKCWDTVSQPDRAVGDVFNLDRIKDDELSRRWMAWTPFQNDACRNCKILPSCAGSCAYKFIHAEDTRGEAAVLPCPSWKYNLKERLLLRAEKSGAITRDDYDPALARTDPAELCAEVHVAGGKPLPGEMQAQLARAKRKLPVVASL